MACPTAGEIGGMLYRWNKVMWNSDPYRTINLLCADHLLPVPSPVQILFWYLWSAENDLSTLRIGIRLRYILLYVINIYILATPIAITKGFAMKYSVQHG